MLGDFQTCLLDEISILPNDDCSETEDKDMVKADLSQIGKEKVDTQRSR